MRSETYKLGEVAETSSGGTPSRGNKRYYSGDIPWIKSGELPDGEIISVEEKITQLGLCNSSAKLLPAGTLVIAMYGATVGKLGVLTTPAATNQAVCAIKPSSQLDQDYLFYWLLKIRESLIESSFGGAQPNISQAVIRDLKIPLPSSILQQREIAAHLKAQLAEVEKARQAAEAQCNDVALLRSRTLESVFSVLDSMPRKKIGDEAKSSSGSTPSRSNKAYWEPAVIAWVKTAEVAFEPIRITEERVSKKAFAECSLKLLPSHTVLIAMYGQGKTRGQSAILEIEATTNQACFAILPNETWEPEFLYLWLQKSYQDLRALSEGRGGNQANLNGALLRAFAVPAPDKSEQRRIIKQVNSALDEIDTLSAACKNTLTEITKMPQKILSQAFSMASGDGLS